MPVNHTRYEEKVLRAAVRGVAARLAWDASAPRLSAVAAGPSRNRGTTIRSSLILIPLLLIFGGIGYRISTIHVVEGERWKRAAVEQQHVRIRNPGPRGRIFASRGETLAYTMPSEILVADLHQVTNPEITARKLSEATGIQADQLARSLSRSDKRVIYLKRDIGTGEADLIRQMKLPGINFESGYKRVYPGFALGCHLIGWAGTDQGKEGIEAQLENLLKGVPGFQRIECDAARRAIFRGGASRSAHFSQPATPGLNIHLTMDLGIQHVAEIELARILKEFSPQGATAIVMHMDTGAILAMASVPKFNLNQPGEAEGSERRNRVLADCYEPGSTFKTVIAAFALEQGLYGRGERLYCEDGSWKHGYRVLHDSHRYTWLTFDEVIINSSNIGAAKMGLRLGIKGVYDAVQAFGFGQRTRIGLMGEENGIVRPFSSWTRDSLLSVPMGQEISVTPLQLVTAYTAMLNGGLLLRPQVVARVTNERDELLYALRPHLVRRVVSPQTSLAMRSILHATVLTGTARLAWCKEYSIGGKTGTAQKVINGSYSHTHYVSSFCGFAPVENPKLVCLVTVDNPQGKYYGGTVAAPAVREILRKGLHAIGVPARTPAAQEAAERVFRAR